MPSIRKKGSREKWYQISLTLYAPSYWATSSPSKKTRSSRVISSSIAMFKASRTVNYAKKWWKWENVHILLSYVISAKRSNRIIIRDRPLEIECFPPLNPVKFPVKYWVPVKLSINFVPLQFQGKVERHGQDIWDGLLVSQKIFKYMNIREFATLNLSYGRWKLKGLFLH